MNILEQVNKPINENLKNIKAPKIIQHLIRLGFYGKPDFSHLFRDIEIKTVDAFFNAFSKKTGSNYSFDDDRAYKVFQTEPALNIDDVIIYHLPVQRFVSPDEVRATLQFLSGDGRHFLDIPEGKEKQDFILGYTHNDKGTIYVLFIRHVCNNGENKIHFCSQLLNQWNNDDIPAGIC